MNDIQIEVNFFEWFDRNYKTKTNAKDLRTTKKLVTRRKQQNCT